MWQQHGLTPSKHNFCVLTLKCITWTSKKLRLLGKRYKQLMQDDIAETDPYFQTRLDALKDIRECTCQLFSIADSIPKARGSGVFVKVGDMHFLLSAAHVFESYDGQLYAPTTLGEKNYTPIGGQLNTNKINTSRQKDTTDLAILELHPDIISPLLSFYSFLDGKYLGLNHNLVNNLYYMYYGYPASKKQTKLKLLENKIIAKPNYFRQFRLTQACMLSLAATYIEILLSNTTNDGLSTSKKTFRKLHQTHTA
ncbi:MAG: hypothetical protein IPJ60_12710 [Sphingobacteriaceae bacterium]|nr:hypothetical protein [Sphingobacteriaceae bacterium]